VLRERLRTVVEETHGLTLECECKTAREGSVALAECAPDLLILDLRLPDGSGFDILAELDDRAGGPLVIVLTNLADPTYRARALAEGATFFFDKSTQFDDFLDTLRGLASGSSSPTA